MDNQVKSLSERLKYIARDNNTYIDHVDTKIKTENLKYNLSLLISKIIIELDITERSKTNFVNCITSYNKSNETSLKFEDFEKILWIRVVNDEVHIPEVVRSFIWKIGQNQENGVPNNIPHGKNDIAWCLQGYYKKYFEKSRLTITKDKLENIIDDFKNEEINIEYLLEIEIIEKSDNADLFYYCNNKYERYLRNEIAATLWLLIGGEEASKENFKFYFKLIQGTQIWIDNIQNYLSRENCSKILELAVTLINEQKDLDKSDEEFSKIWLDLPSYAHIEIHQDVPKKVFNYNSSLDFIDDIDNLKWHYPYAFDYQKTRSFTLSLLRLIISLDAIEVKPYEETIKIIKNTDKPHLVWTLYKDIISQKPEILPYLIKDKELIPLALRKVDKLGISENLLDKSKTREEIQDNNNKTFEEFYFDFLDIIFNDLAIENNYSKENAKLIATILSDNANNTFKHTNNYSSEIDHDYYRNRYDKIIKKLSNLKISKNHNNVATRYILGLIPLIIDFVLEKSKSNNIYKNEYLKLSSGHLDLLIEILRILSMPILEDEVSDSLKQNISNGSIKLINSIQDYLINYFSVTEMNVITFDSNGFKKKQPVRGVNEFGLEIIDWGFLYIQFDKYDLFDSTYEKIVDSFKLDKSTTVYDYNNKEQFEKIKLLLKTLMLAHYGIHFRKDLYEIEELKPFEILTKLESKIKELSIKHSVDELDNGRINVFIERYDLFGYNKYYQRLTTLLFDNVNLFKSDDTEKFIYSFFEKNNDIGSMLSALNSIENKKSQDVLVNRIKKVKIEKFIKSNYSLSNLEYAVIEAINSENHWDLAKPILIKIKKHLDLIKQNTYESKKFLFEVELLLALKENDIDGLKKIEIPENQYSYPRVNNTAINEKMFFVALHHLFNDKKFDEATKQLKILLSKDEKNIKYAFYLYKSQITNPKNENQAIIKAFQDWDSFLNLLSEEERKGISRYNDSILENNLHYYIAINEPNRFDQTYSNLKPKFKFNLVLIPKIYSFYCFRELDEIAFDYLAKAQEYLNEMRIVASSEVIELFDNAENVNLFKRLKISLEKIRTLKAKNIPQITPDIINDKNKLGEFILYELVQASIVLTEKIHGVKKNPDEDRYNDLLLAILRLRFQIWGWSIHDQSRTGTSSTGKSAGESDITIQAGNNTIALFEALILKGKDKTETQKHILKTFDYSKSLERYYMIVYFKGKSDKFDSTWDTYLQDASECKFKVNNEFNTSIGYKDMAANFDDIRNLKISKSIHGSNIEMFHIMIDLSE